MHAACLEQTPNWRCPRIRKLNQISHNSRQTHAAALPFVVLVLADVDPAVLLSSLINFAHGGLKVLFIVTGGHENRRVAVKVVSFGS